MYDIDVDKVFKNRLLILEELRQDPVKLGHLKKFYVDHPVEFINDWGITYDPRKLDGPKKLPFILFPKQVDLILWLKDLLEKQQEGAIEKTREVGVTWVCVAFACWMFIFHPETKISFGSRKEELVDKIGNPDSIFEKIRMFLQYVPIEFRPNYDDNYLKISNKDNKAIITGEAGDNMGRGGRGTIYFLDEFAFVERSNRVEAAVSSNTDCRVYLSTANGSNNMFFRKVHSGNIPVFTFSWRDDPRKDQDWYDKRKKELDPLIFAQEVDISYEVDSEMLIIPKKYISCAINLNIPKLGEGIKRIGFDVADEGVDKNAICIGQGNKIDKVIDWDDDDPNSATRYAYGVAIENDVTEIKYDSIGVGAGAKGEFRSLLSKSKNDKIKAIAINVGAGVNKENEYQVVKGIKNEDMFMNLKAESWWRVRRMFEKTYDYVVNKNKDVDVNDLISIPDDSALINELSQVRYKRKENGKILIEKKEDMRKRGIKSPNKADSLVLYFAVTKIKKPMYNFYN